MTGRTKKEDWNTWRAARAAALAVLMLLGAGLALVAQSQATVLNVNNVHCAQSNGNPLVVMSGPPYHDHHSQDLRGNCDGILEEASGDLTRYSVGIGQAPRTYGDLYLRSPFGVNIEGRVCLTSVHPSTNPWECSALRDWDRPDWGRVVTKYNIDIPGASLPQNIFAWVGFSESSGPPYVMDAEESGSMIRYDGALSHIGEIQDPQADDSYLEAVNFTSWRVHDPGEDDLIALGGVAVQLDPGTRLTLPDDGIEIEYRASGEGGHEWLVSSDEEDRVFVWDDTEGEWHIKRLDYER